MLKMEKALGKIELLLSQSKTGYIMGGSSYTMVDLYGFPHVSRIFYMRESALDKLYHQIQFEEKYPHIFMWVNKIRSCPELNDGKAIINVKPFHKWVEELVTLPLGKKPPLRIPMKL